MPARPEAPPALEAPLAVLLRAVARRYDPVASPARIAALPLDTIPWDAVPAQFARHGLTILGAAHLSAVRERMPAAHWSRLDEDARRARAAALGMFGELRRLLAQLQAANVDALPYKGPLLGWDAYGDLAARPFVDLDLLVRPEHTDAAFRTLIELGYERTHWDTPARESWFRRVDGDYQLVHHESGLLVELHARAMSRRFGPGLETDALWRRRRVVNVPGGALPAPSPDDTLYLQLVHGAKHRWERLEWVAAAAELLRQRTGDLAALLQPPYHAPRAVLLGAHLAHVVLDAPLATATAAAIAADSAIPPLGRTAIGRLFDPAAETDRDDTSAKLAFNFRVQRGVVARTRFLYRWACWPTPEDWSDVSLPDWLFSGYRAVRPLRLVGRYLGRRSVPRQDAPND